MYMYVGIIVGVVDGSNAFTAIYHNELRSVCCMASEL